MSYGQGSYQAPVLDRGYFDVPMCDQYSNPNPMNSNVVYPGVSMGQLNTTIQGSYSGGGGYTVQPSNVETFVGSRESTYKYIGNNGYASNPYTMSINHSNDQFPAQVYTSTGVQLRVDPRMSSSKIEDNAYKAKTQMMMGPGGVQYAGGYAQQFAPNNPFTMPQMGMNYHNPSAGMGMWNFEPPYSEPVPTYPAVPVQMPMTHMMGGGPMMGGCPMMGGGGPMMPNMVGGQPMGPQMMTGGGPQQMMMGGGGPQRSMPEVQIEDVASAGGKRRRRRVVQAGETPLEDLEEKKPKDKSVMGKINRFLTANSTIYWLIVLLVVLVVAFVVKTVYVDK